MQKFLEPERKPKVIYTDNSSEFGKACEDLSWNHCTSTPHRSETNGIAERAVRRGKESTSAVLLQSGLNENWWAGDQLVGNEIARLSACGVVILSEFLSPNFALNSTVRNVLRGWIAHGDVAAVWFTQPLTSSTAACLLKTCHEANVVGFYAESSTIRSVSLSSTVSTVPLASWKYQWICVRLKLARRCNNFGHVCSVSGKAHRLLGFCFQDRFLHRTHRVQCARFVARALVHSCHAKDSLTNKQRWLS